MSATYVELEHPRGPHGEWIKKNLPGIKGKTAPKSFKFYKQGYTPKAKSAITGHNVHVYGKQLYTAKKAGHFANDYEYWLAAGKLAQQAKKKHGAKAPTPHAIVNSAFNHELDDTGAVNMLDANPNKPQTSSEKHVHMTTPGGVKAVSKFLAPGQLEWTGKTLGGVSGARIYKDHKGVEWIVKVPGGWKGTSKAYSNSKFLADLDVATSRIQNKAGLPVPAMHKTVVDGRVASVQKMYADPSPAFPSNAVKLGMLTDEDKLQVQRNMVLDWLISNHDPHTANFLETRKGIVGIDKGQAFKYFGKDKLTPSFGSDLNPPLAPNKPVYSTLMSQHLSGEGKLLSFNDGELATTIKRIQDIPDDEYKDLLRPYAEEAAKLGVLAKFSSFPNDVNAFLIAATNRKNNLANDFAALDKELNPAPAVSSPKAKPTGIKIPGENASWATVKLGDKVEWEGTTYTVGVKYGSHVSTETEDHKIGPNIYSTSFQFGEVHWAADKPMQAAATDKLAPGYKVVKQLSDGKEVYKIQKPNGSFSQNKENVDKTWPTMEEALNSSTMAKYKGQVEQQAKAGMAGAQKLAQAAPDITPGSELNLTQSAKYQLLKTKLAAGEEHTPDEYLEFKQLVKNIHDQAKASGAAQVEEDYGGGFTAQPAKPAKKAKGGFKEQPKFKKSGGAPPELSLAKGDNALQDGKKLWDLKKSGKIVDDYQMWSEAKKLANKAKKSGMANPSSANQIRNVAMRLEFDETGDVVWETAEEKTSEVEGQTVAEIKHEVGLHDHKPTLPHQPGQKIAEQSSTFPDAFSSSAPAGSYNNPHTFGYGDTKNLRAYGYKYTKHGTWDSNQKNAWYNFSSSGYQHVNTFFRTGEVGLYGDVESAKKRAKALVDAFNSDHVKPLDDWTLVSRGTSGGWELGIGADTVTFDELKGQVGKVVRNKCPVSSSLRDRPAFSHRPLRITYKLPPGFRGLGILGHSAHPSEDEMILPPGMAYRILEVKKGNQSFGTEVLVEVVDVKMPEIT